MLYRDAFGLVPPADRARRCELLLLSGEALKRVSDSEEARAAAWIEGFLIGGGLLLVHDPKLLALIDQWLSAIAPDTFTEVLPLLRRGFGAFPSPERRASITESRASAFERSGTLE